MVSSKPFCIGLLVIVCIFCQNISAIKQYDNYVLEAQTDCKSGKSYWSCMKYRLGRYLWSLELGAFHFVNGPRNGIELITLNNTDISTELFPEARFSSGNFKTFKKTLVKSKERL